MKAKKGHFSAGALQVFQLIAVNSMPQKTAFRLEGLLQKTPFLFLQPHFSPPHSMCDPIKHMERENDPVQAVPHLTFRPLGNIKNSLCLYVSLLNATEKTYALFLFH